MVTPDEAVRVVEAMVATIPEEHKNKMGLLISKEIADGLLWYASLLKDHTLKKSEHGQTIIWRGIICRVA